MLSAAQFSLGPVKCFPDHAEMASHDVAMCDLKSDTFLTTSDWIGWLQKELAQGSSGECKKRLELKRIFKVGSYLQFKCHVWVV